MPIGLRDVNRSNSESERLSTRSWAVAGRARILVLAAVVSTIPAAGAAMQSADSVGRTDYLTFAQGAVPLSIGGPGAALGPNAEHQVHWIDGNPTPRGFIRTEDPDVVTEFTYELPALTTFDRLAVPSVLEVPSPSTTFARNVEVLGSALGPTDGFVTLASGTLTTHDGRDQVTELAIVASVPVRWVMIRLSGGIEVLADPIGIEFSEIIGNGRQEAVPLAEHFTGAWDSRFVKMELEQRGPLVVGCYDSQAELEGTVTGNTLRARGVDLGGARTESLFVLSVLPDGTLTGVRSTNGGPFRLYSGGPVDDVPRLRCVEPPPPRLGCGSVIHGINFGFDSAEILPASGPVLARLYDGLQGDQSAAVDIVGHTSSEGSEEYNRGLSERRAGAVVADLVARGLGADRLNPVGAGEGQPIASNDDEAGRALNRRVEVVCR